MTEYDRDSWEQRWSQALRKHGDGLAQRPPNAHLTAEIGDLRPGRALDAGCGHGSEALWLAAPRMAGHRRRLRRDGPGQAAAGQVQVSVEAALAALDPGQWQPVIAEERPRPAGNGVDAVIRARRR